MADEERTSAPDQNDPTGHTREGSPTYHPADPPANNHRVQPARPPAQNAEEAREQGRAGVLERRPGTDPDIPEMPKPTVGPD